MATWVTFRSAYKEAKLVVFLCVASLLPFLESNLPLLLSLVLANECTSE